ncbi:hypothetical protein C8Q77DRAFT_1158537 [Trametes polyzona]|nr:hypothetical protein C8Q77DRAFT_1158537 [Trametes polyzona]
MSSIAIGHGSRSPVEQDSVYSQSPALLLWSSFSVEASNGIFVGPDGEITTSSNSIAPDSAVAPPAANKIAATNSISQADGSTVAVSSSNTVPPTSTGASITTQVSTTTTEQTSSASSETSSSDLTASSFSVSLESSTTLPSQTSSSDVVSTTSYITSVSTGVVSTPTEPTTIMTISSSTTTDAGPSSTSEDPVTAAGASPTSRVNSASSSDNSDRATSFYIGIAFAAIAGAGLIVAVLAWWLRIRSRTRRRKRNNTTSWPWDSDHDRLGARQMSLEGGLGIHGYEGDMLQRSALSSPAFPAPPPPAHTAGGGGSPYVTISLHDAHQSVPDLAPDLGTLQITNLAPGDLPSGGESSRASTALGMLHTYPAEYGTPFMPHRPCFLGVEGAGLEVPWAPLRVGRSGSVTAPAGSRPHPPPPLPPARQDSADLQMSDVPLPYPGDLAVTADPHPPPSDARQGSWAASIRSNLLNAFNAVVGGSPSQVPMAHANDPFTPVPHRNSQRARASPPRGPRDGGQPGVGRSSSAESAADARAGWALGPHHPARAPAQDPFADDLQIPPLPTPSHSGRDERLLFPSVRGSVTRASSMYSTISANPQTTDRIGDDPPRLPDIPSLARTDSTDSSDTSEPRAPQDDLPSHKSTSKKLRTRTRTHRLRRPALPSRTSSGQRSAMSVGSDMSRTSSVCSELTDGERFAKDALRARRRRVMEMSGVPVGRGKTRRARATLSRRRSNERAEAKRMRQGHGEGVDAPSVC